MANEVSVARLCAVFQADAARARHESATYTMIDTAEGVRMLGALLRKQRIVRFCVWPCLLRTLA